MTQEEEARKRVIHPWTLKMWEANSSGTRHSPKEEDGNRRTQDLIWEDDSINTEKVMDMTEESTVSKEKEREKGNRISKTPDAHHIKEGEKRKDMKNTEKEITREEEKAKERPQHSTGAATDVA